jgi:FkbM family methyltransferase
VLDSISRYSFPHAVSRPDGRRFTIALPAIFDDLHSFREVVMARTYDSPWVLQDISTIADLGANVGMALFYFTHATDVSRIVAIEANPALIPRLRRAAARLPLPVEVLHGAVAAGSGDVVSFEVSENNRLGRVGSGGQTVTVPRMGLGDVLSKLGGSADLLKIDVEGAEHQLLESEPEAWRACRYIVGETHGAPAARDRFAARLAALGFELDRVVGKDVDTFCARRAV